MYITLSNSDPAPLYEQIKKQIIEQVVQGTLRAGEMLPSIRAMAKELEISVITVKKAYEDLETEGYIVTKQGVGSCVAEAGAEFVREMKLKAIQQHWEQGIAGCRELGMSDEEILRNFRLIMDVE
ncbi:GntR family transcriptional regulator [Gorillibacterium sp. sgz5001074]|uniref:GntR family transcriptional regulator n=1 Tax=Gorillibacterium sp. sgz5001074 TaxID=3446695 RepID=UPI003F672B1C